MSSKPTIMQRIAVVCWVFTFVVFFVIGPVLTLILLFTPLRELLLLYLLWVYFIDLKTSERGGRKIETLHNFFLWNYFYDYFPVKSVLSAPLELDPERNYIMPVFPHGVYCVGRFSFTLKYFFVAKCCFNLLYLL